MCVKQVSVFAAGLAAATVLASCAIRADFAAPSALETERYTKEPLKPTAASAPPRAHDGRTWST